ncbi:hypothetical protein LTR56_026117 [Elasticomyces elasticus]|nr:hypothetical protein LTR56_026117 [Elasticomyces elasticus]KAK3624372.1 hypothetical protein LTR22_023990 [Elasticomyces elasticus]KAK4910487.1 hypothetical protein LTR49_020843 [Elasticomyces elasticus]KAK5745243.1 hypothetical protein LTS12_023175 [Elasticomyces elasticus]
MKLALFLPFAGMVFAQHPTPKTPWGYPPRAVETAASNPTWYGYLPPPNPWGARATEAAAATTTVTAPGLTKTTTLSHCTATTTAQSCMPIFTTPSWCTAPTSLAKSKSCSKPSLSTTCTTTTWTSRPIASLPKPKMPTLSTSCSTTTWTSTPLKPSTILSTTAKQSTILSSILSTTAKQSKTCTGKSTGTTLVPVTAPTQPAPVTSLTSFATTTTMPVSTISQHGTTSTSCTTKVSTITMPIVYTPSPSSATGTPIVDTASSSATESIPDVPTSWYIYSQSSSAPTPVVYTPSSAVTTPAYSSSTMVTTPYYGMNSTMNWTSAHMPSKASSKHGSATATPKSPTYTSPAQQASATNGAGTVQAMGWMMMAVAATMFAMA